MAATHPMTPVSLTETQHKKRQKIDKSFEAILEMLNLEPATRVPLVQSAFSSAARIFDISQQVGANQDEFGEFAEGACRLVYSISLKLEDEQEIEQNMGANLARLVKTLESIESIGEQCAANTDSEIKAQRQEMEECMRSFEFQSLHDLREKTNELIVKQQGKNGGVSDTTTNNFNVTRNKTNYAFNNVRVDNNVIGSSNSISSTFDRMIFRHNTSKFGNNSISHTLDRIWGAKK